jgi:hypothetical protein
MTMRNLARERSTGDAAEVLPPVERLEAVVPRISAPILGHAALVAEAAPPAVVVDVAHDATPELPRRSAYLVAGFMVATATVAQVDVRLGLTFGATVCAGVGVRWIDRHVTFSFGQGFVGYRGDAGWPHGVQEDDDVHWNWNARRSEPQTHRP